MKLFKIDEFGACHAREVITGGDWMEVLDSDEPFINIHIGEINVDVILYNQAYNDVNFPEFGQHENEVASRLLGKTIYGDVHLVKRDEVGEMDGFTDDEVAEIKQAVA